MTLPPSSPTTRPPQRPADQALAEPPPGIEYFTQQALERSIDVSAKLDSVPFEVACFVCNLWHPTPVLEKWFGKNFSEWELVRRAAPLFEGHLQPKQPLWGFFPEDTVEWATREIDLAASSGIDIFMVDWYWHSATQLLHEWLENAFLKSPSRHKLKFAVMWANHDWPNFYPSPASGQEAVLLPQTYSESAMDRMTDYLIEHYFSQSNHWRIDDKPVFGIWGVDFILNAFGGATNLRKTFDRMRARAIKSNFKGIHFQACDIYTPGVTPIEDAGFDSATRYHMFPFGGQTNRTRYAEAAAFSIRMWKEQSARMKIPYFPDCPVGWDNSPRFGQRAHVFVNRTADQYERLLLAAKHFVVQQKTTPPVVYLSTWNEWTEDHYLLPDQTHGYSYLEAVQRQFPR
ncbi:MAG TPA: glycoside hydrolase family 99-like domain-containing protein [Tepidisphaeraceae bacterium]|jgi:hypothetical protein